MQRVLPSDLAGKANGKETPAGTQILAPLMVFLSQLPGHVTLAWGSGLKPRVMPPWGTTCPTLGNKFAKSIA